MSQFHAYQSCRACSKKVQPGTRDLMKYLILRFPQSRSMGIYSCRDVRGGASLSIHSCGRAGDSGVPTLSNGRANTELGDPIVLFLLQFAAEFGMMGVIYNRVRYDRGDPRGAYYGGVHPHYDHLHWEQVDSKAKSLTMADYIRIAGAPTPSTGDEYEMKKGDPKSAAVAELQRALRVNFSFNLVDADPHPGRSLYQGRPPFARGEDGDFGTGTEDLVKGVQKGLSLPQTGVVDGVLAAIIFGLYDESGGGGGLTAAQVDAKISTHANDADAHHE